jgi:hypothetical protein
VLLLGQLVSWVSLPISSPNYVPVRAFGPNHASNPRVQSTRLCEKHGIHGTRGQHSQSTPGVARQIDKLQHPAVGIVKIGAWAVEHAALPVLLERDLDTMSAQMVERRWVPLMCDVEERSKPPSSSSTGLIGGSRFTRMRHVAVASRKAMSPRGTVDRCLQPTISV